MQKFLLFRQSLLLLIVGYFCSASMLPELVDGAGDTLRLLVVDGDGETQLLVVDGLWEVLPLLVFVLVQFSSV